MMEAEDILLEVRNVSKFYSGHTALADVSLKVPKGSIYGLLGPNGAGKTSLIRIITQITAADEGEIILNGERLAPKHVASIGYLPEERGLYKKMKVGEQLMYLARLKGISNTQIKEKLKYWINRFDLKPWVGKNIEDLSKGMQQKVQFIATVIHDPTLIILDEPFSGFDPINANLIKEEIFKLREAGSTVIFSTHRMESVEELCDYIALINKSRKVLEGAKADIKENYRNQTFYLDCDQVLASEPGLMEVYDSKDMGYGRFRHFIKNESASVNNLLQKLMERVDVYGLEENIPSMNDIFIETVGNDFPEEMAEVLK